MKGLSAAINNFLLSADGLLAGILLLTLALQLQVPGELAGLAVFGIGMWFFVRGIRLLTAPSPVKGERKGGGE